MNKIIDPQIGLPDEAVEKLNEAAASCGYWSPDLAPVPPSARTWGLKDITALWVALSACIPTYMLASSLIAEGMNWWQAVLTIFLGNLIVLVPMVLNAHAGTRYGIPFPVYCRAAFGIRGANILTVETMEKAFRGAGLCKVRWHQPEVSPEGIREFGPQHWERFLAWPPVAFIECVK